MKEYFAYNECRTKNRANEKRRLRRRRSPGTDLSKCMQSPANVTRIRTAWS